MDRSDGLPVGHPPPGCPALTREAAPMLRGGLSAALGVLVAIPAVLSAAPISLSMADRDQLAVYARDTWRSLDALAGTGVLPADNLVRTDAGWVPGAYTSPT